MPDINAGIIALLNTSDELIEELSRCNLGNTKLIQFSNVIEMCKDFEKLKLNIVAIFTESEVMGTLGVSMLDTLKQKGMGHIPYCIFCEKLNDNLIMICLQAGVSDVFVKPVDQELVEKRINFLMKHWAALQKKVNNNGNISYKTPFIKRAFDIIFSSMAIICLSPIILIVIIIMKLESKGPIFYYSLRVGTGYRVFKFYKFRSMYVNADQRIKELKHLNQYNTADKAVVGTNDSNTLCEECTKAGEKRCRSPLYADNTSWCEKQYLDTKKIQSGSAFFKLKNDPRITRVGNFLRNTSIDELPQLYNVLKGDMSIVGNRPLPLYEAEKLTTDKYALRFLAPAGLTGLWQVEKRGKGKMSEEERLMLDNTYAENHSFWYDIKLILKTVPALFQKENV